MSTKVEEKGKTAEVLHVDSHAGYAAAKARMAEIGRRREAAETALREALNTLSEYEASGIDIEAKAALEGKRPDENKARALRTVDELQKESRVLNRAAQLQTHVVQELHELASIEIVEKLKPEYLQIEREYYQTLVALVKLVEAKGRWCERVCQMGVLAVAGGLGFGNVTPFGSAVGSPTEPEAAMNWHLREGIRRGAIRREEVPAHWKWVY